MSLEHWLHLKDNKFHSRYKIVASLIDTTDMKILDLDCGEPDFSKYTKHKEYVCNDVFPINNPDVHFKQVSDTEIDEPSDLLVMFGYGCGEFTGVEQESKTAMEAIVRNSKHKPKYVVVETATKFFEAYNILNEFKNKLNGYELEYHIKLDVSLPDNHYHNKREIIIFKYK